MITIKHKFIQSIILISTLIILSSCASSQHDANDSRATIDDIEQTVNIAIMTPISGKDETLGREYSRMIKMGINDGASTKIQLFSYDVGGNIMTADSIEKMVDQDIDIIIGPILSTDTLNIAEKMKNRPVTIVSLSNNPAIADKDLFVMGHMPMKQINKITEYFLTNNHKKFLLLLPSGNYSSTSSKILTEKIVMAGGTVEKIIFYQNDGNNIDESVSEISNAVDMLNENDTNLTLPVILISDDQFMLEKLFSSIKKYNLDKKSIIAGDNRLDLNFSNQIDAIYTGSWNIVNGDVKQRANKFNIKDISFLHAIAYDAGKIVAQSIDKNYTKEKFVDNLKKSKSFSGISGNITFNDSTIAQREYDLIRRTDGVESAITDKK